MKGELRMKKLKSLFLVLAICLSLAVPALATGEESSGKESIPCASAEVAAACRHTPGLYIDSEWRESDKFDPFIYCYYNVLWIHVKCAECNTPYVYETTEESYATHQKQYVVSGSVTKGFTCTKCNYCSWKALPGVPEVTE